jgi:hypothetical protein
MLAPFVFSSIQPYPPVAIAVLFYLKFVWGSAPPPLSGAQGTTPSLLVSFFFFFSCVFLIQFLGFGFFPFFPWAGVSLSRELC